VAWVNNNSGYRHDMRALAALAHARGAFLYADAVQFMGTAPVNVHTEGVDFCTAGTYKWLMAGFGAAAFYVRRELLDRMHPANVGWRSPASGSNLQQKQSARKFEYATLSFGDLYELAASLEYLQRIGLDKIEARSQALAKRFWSGLADRKINLATPANNRSPIVSFYISKSPAEAEKIIAAERVKVSTQAAAPQTRVRVSLSFFNTESEVDRMLAVAEKLAQT
jgi:selenocysteine lyase/cysteine desulfurase